MVNSAAISSDFGTTTTSWQCALAKDAADAVGASSGTAHATPSSNTSRRWHCEACGRRTPPVCGVFMREMFGSLINGARHHCRTCDRTVCGACSIVPLGGERICQACYLRADEDQRTVPQREKFVFLVRHAQSIWNQNVDMVKTLPQASLQTFTIRDVVSRAASLMAKEMWNRDHPISTEGVRQTCELRQKIAEGRQCETERERRYYESFSSRPKQVYCSPLLRALQTAHLALPEEDGWGSIKLLKDARERFSFVFERDCLGTSVGADIVDRAVQMGQELPGIRQRVDATDCAQKWWSDEPETEADLEARLTSLWRRIFEEDSDDNCVLVTHSNLIKALLMRFGGLDEVLEQEDHHKLGSPPRLPESGDNTALKNGKSLDDSNEDLVDEASTDCKGDRRRVHASQEGSCWQVVDGGSEALRRLKVERLQNCGVLGLHCVLEVPPPKAFPEVDGFVDVDTQAASALAAPAAPNAIEPRWVAKDALLMFDSGLVK